MNRFIFSLMVFAFTVFNAEAQTFTQVKHSVSVYDTLSASELDTIPISTQWKTGYNYEWWYRTDSLSGATDAKLYLEICPYGQTLWYTKDSVTVNGAVPQIGFVQGTVKTGGGIRMRSAAGSGTQSTKVEQYLQLFRYKD